MARPAVLHCSCTILRETRGFIESSTDMPDSYSLFRARRYKESLVAAKKEAASIRRNDCFKIGPAMTVGQSLIVLGRFREAQVHLEQLAAKRHAGARIGSHFTYAGIAYWFDGGYDRAIELWQAGLGATYQAERAMEIPWILLYAAGRVPGCFPRDRAMQLIQYNSKRLVEADSLYWINQFAIQRKEYQWVLDKLAHDYQSDPVAAEHNTIRFAPRWLADDRSHLDFLAGAHALFGGELDRFYGQMVACASITGHLAVSAQMIIAECEIRHGPPKWKRRFAKWLRENVCPNGKPKKSRGKTSRP